MSKKKVWGIVAILAILAGLLIVATVFFSVGFNFSKLSKEIYARTAYTPEESFDEIEIHSTFFDVKLLPLAEGEEPLIYLPFSGNLSHRATVQDGKLSIFLEDGRTWYERWSLFNVSNENTVIELHLPMAGYDKLKVKLNSGDIYVDKRMDEEHELTFSHVKLETSTGDIQFGANTKGGGSISLSAGTGDIAVSGAQGVSLCAEVSTGHISLWDCVLTSVNATATTGDIKLENVQGTGMVLKLSSGDIKLTNVSAGSMALTASTGDVELFDVLVEGELRAETGTGEIDIERSDAGSLWIETDTGDVEMTLLSGKMYHVETGTGERRYPEHDRDGGRCVVKTDTGDVEITVIPK